MITEEEKRELMSNPEAMKAEKERCKDIVYFYNKYIRKDGEEEYTQEKWERYLKEAEIRRSRNPYSDRPLLRPEDCQF